MAEKYINKYKKKIVPGVIISAYDRVEIEILETVGHHKKGSKPSPHKLIAEDLLEQFPKKIRKIRDIKKGELNPEKIDETVKKINSSDLSKKK